MEKATHHRGRLGEACVSGPRRLRGWVCGIRKKISRAEFLPVLSSQPRCEVAMEACVGVHGWARDVQAQGHEVRLIAPAYVKLLVKRQKNDMADAEAITEAEHGAAGPEAGYAHLPPASAIRARPSRAPARNARCQRSAAPTSAVAKFAPYAVFYPDPEFIVFFYPAAASAANQQQKVAP